MKERILVTGHTGFIGQALARRLHLLGYEVVGLSASSGQDITDAQALARVPHAGIRHVVHLAGRTFVPASWEDPEPFYRVNVLGTQHVLDYCRCHSVPVTFVSTYSYGQPRYLPVDEQHPLCPANPYAHSKYLAEELCRFYAAHYGLSVTIARPFNVYGPGQPEHFLVPSIIKQALHADAITLHDLAPRRDYIYVDDVVSALCCFVSRPHHFIEYNLGCGVSFSVVEVVETVLRVTGKTLPVRSDAQVRNNEIADTVADITRMRQDFGWCPEYTLQAGIEALCAHARG